jgi:SAM-dependent methyltransferase
LELAPKAEALSITDIQRSRTGLDLEGLRRAVLDMRSFDQPTSLLDVGCGFGGLTKFVASQVGAKIVHGVDIDARVLNEARAKGVLACQIDIGAQPLPYRSGSIHYVVSLGMMDYLEFFDGMIRECSRVLRPKGRVLISLPNLASWHNRLMLLRGYQPRDVEISSEVLVGVPRTYKDRGDRPTGHIHVPTVHAFRELMEHHGFGEVAVLPGSPDIQTSNPIWRLVDWLAGKSPHLARRFFYVGEKIRETPRGSLWAKPFQCL